MFLAQDKNEIKCSHPWMQVKWIIIATYHSDRILGLQDITSYSPMRQMLTHRRSQTWIHMWTPVLCSHIQVRYKILEIPGAGWRFETTGYGFHSSGRGRWLGRCARVSSRPANIPAAPPARTQRETALSEKQGQEDIHSFVSHNRSLQNRVMKGSWSLSKHALGTQGEDTYSIIFKAPTAILTHKFEVHHNTVQNSNKTCIKHYCNCILTMEIIHKISYFRNEEKKRHTSISQDINTVYYEFSTNHRFIYNVQISALLGALSHFHSYKDVSIPS